jgi:hypothetical protein
MAFTKVGGISHAQEIVSKFFLAFPDRAESFGTNN